MPCPIFCPPLSTAPPITVPVASRAIDFNTSSLICELSISFITPASSEDNKSWIVPVPAPTTPPKSPPTIAPLVPPYFRPNLAPATEPPIASPISNLSPTSSAKTDFTGLLFTSKRLFFLSVT